MNTAVLSLAYQLSNQEVVARVKLLAQREREATAALIAHLAVLDERQLYLAEGCGSMFTYCVQVLHLSEYAAYSRIEAARAARKYPVILDMLGDGSVNLTTVGLLVPELTPENHTDLFEAARHKSKRHVQELIAHLRPQPPVPSSVHRLASPRLAAENPCPDNPAALTLELSPAAEAPVPARRPVIAPLAPQQYKVQFTASAETHAKLLQAQELLRAQIPDGDVGEIIDRALTALLNDLTKRKFAATDRPRETATVQSSGHVTSRLRSSERYGGAMTGNVPSWPMTGAAVQSGPSSSFITSCPTVRAEKLRSRTSSSGAARTMDLRPRCSSAVATASLVARATTYL
jgi:hypothetical protein